MVMPSRSRSSAKQVEDAGLHGDVQGGGGLVGDQQPGPVGDGHGDQHALRLAAGDLVRIGPHALQGLVDAHQLQQLGGAVARLAGPHVAVQQQGFGHLVANPVVGVERRHRLLEHHADLGAPDGAHLARLCPQQFAPAKADPRALAVDARRRGHQARNGKGGDGFARTGLAGQAQGGAGPHRKADAVQRPHLAMGGAEQHIQVLHLHQRGGGFGGGRLGGRGFGGSPGGWSGGGSLGRRALAWAGCHLPGRRVRISPSMSAIRRRQPRISPMLKKPWIMSG